MMASQDTEITLGTGKMLTLFFGLVALNGAFFGMGYTLGRAGTHNAFTAADQSQPANGPVLRPSAMKSGSASSSAQRSDNPSLSKTAAQQDASATSSPASTATNASSSSSNAEAASEGKQADASPDAATVLAAANYFVQVAAVSKQDDAQALVEALKKKQYTAFATNSSPSDKLYHVQVGPFGDVKEAEATKAKLVSDGYNPILKK
jgi:cell division septation protein DedD